MKARYPSVCPVCGKPVAVGEEISKVENRWQHTTCPSGDSSVASRTAPTILAEARILHASDIGDWPPPAGFRNDLTQINALLSAAEDDTPSTD